MGRGALDFRAYVSEVALGAHLVAAYRPEAWLSLYGEGRVLKPYSGPLEAFVGVGVRGEF